MKELNWHVVYFFSSISFLVSQSYESLTKLCLLLTEDEAFRKHKVVLEDRCQWLLGLGESADQGTTEQVLEFFETRSAQIRGLKQLQLYLLYHSAEGEGIETSGTGVDFVIKEISRIVVSVERLMEK